jgi:hypothetical protein
MHIPNETWIILLLLVFNWSCCRIETNLHTPIIALSKNRSPSVVVFISAVKNAIITLVILSHGKCYKYTYIKDVTTCKADGYARAWIINKIARTLRSLSPTRMNNKEASTTTNYPIATVMICCLLHFLSLRFCRLFQPSPLTYTERYPSGGDSAVSIMTTINTKKKSNRYANDEQRCWCNWAQCNAQL